MESTWELLVMTLQVDFQNTEPMVWYTRAMTYTNGCDDIYQTDKEPHQPFSEIHIDHD